jgi:transmembrane sensor
MTEEHELAQQNLARQDREDLARAAHAWVRRLTSGEATVADAEALARWCAQSPAHKAAFTDAGQLWRAFGPAGERLRELGLAPARGYRPRINRRAMIGIGIAAAAAGVAGVAIVRPPLDLWPSIAELMADYRTGTGERRQIAVAGASIEMNTRTSIAVRTAAAGSQRIELISGEAAIAVAHDKPLSVVAADGVTMADDAKFNVRVEGRAGIVSCLDGAVRVACHGRELSLGGRQQVSYDDRGLGSPVPIDPDIAAAWQRGLLIFRATPLTAVIAELNRYRSGRIVLLNAALGQRPINGRFRIDRPDDVLAQIELAFGAHLTSLPGGVVLVS